MAKDYLNQPYNEMRRKDRAKDDAWIKSFLRRAPFGVMATSYEEQPFTNTRQFVYDEARQAIYVHGAKKGRTFNNVQANPRVCFSVSEMGRLLPGKRAMNFSVEFSGVVIFGRAVLVTDPAEAKYCLQLLVDKYFPHLLPGADYEPATDTDLKVTAVFRIDIESWSGKEKKVEGNPPGAFYYGEK